MSDTLYSILNFTAVPLGGTQTLAHNLVCNALPLKPDIVLLQFQNEFEFVGATTTNLTIRNTGSATGNCQAMCHAIHPVERSFGQSPDDGTFAQHMTPQPFVPGSPNSGGGGGGPFNILVFRPGGTAGENVFTDWTLLMGALAGLQGTRVIQFDDSLVSPIIIPVGGPYDMTGVTWSTVPDHLVQVQIPEGASFTKLRTFTDRIHVRFTGTTPPIADFTFSDELVTIDNGAELSASGAGPMINVVGSNATFFVGAQAGFFLIAHAVVNVGAAVTVSVFMQGSESTLAASTFSGIVGATLNLVLATSAPFVYSTSQAAFLGTLSAQNASRTFNFPITPIVANTVLGSVATSQLVLVDPTGGAFALTLPAAAAVRAETILIVNAGASANNVTVTAGAGDNINGAATSVQAGAHFVLRVTSDGVNTWFITT
jgi:hypothetical protein